MQTSSSFSNQRKKIDQKEHLATLSSCCFFHLRVEGPGKWLHKDCLRSLFKNASSHQSIIYCTLFSSVCAGLTHLDAAAGTRTSKMTTRQRQTMHPESSRNPGPSSGGSYPAPSSEDLHSRCGSRQSLLDSASHRSHLSVSGAAHQYANAGCNASSGAVNATPQQSPGKQVGRRANEPFMQITSSLTTL